MIRILTFSSVVALIGKRVVRTICSLIGAVALGAMLFATNATAATIFESGTLGPTGIYINEIGGGIEPGSSGVNPSVFSAVRFQVGQTAMTTRVGGHFVADPRFTNSFFGAIVRLDNAMDFPDSGNLSTPDVLGATLLTFPNPSAEAFGNLGVKLDPGWYSLVFGSGLFGATGSGAAVLNNPDIGSPSYIAHQTGSGWLELSTLPASPGLFHNFRLVVEGFVIPEPNSVALALLVIFCLFSLRSIRR